MRFVLVCSALLGLTALVCAPESVLGQSPPRLIGLVELFLSDGLHTLAVDDQGRVYVGGTSPGTSWTSSTQLPPGLPTSASVSSLPGSAQVYVAVQDGDIYSVRQSSISPNGPIPFQLMGNVFGGIVGTERDTWSRMKGAYRK